jgi:hypothetical protein
LQREIRALRQKIEEQEILTKKDLKCLYRLTPEKITKVLEDANLVTLKQIENLSFRAKFMRTIWELQNQARSQEIAKGPNQEINPVNYIGTSYSYPGSVLPEAKETVNDQF